MDSLQKQSLIFDLKENIRDKFKQDIFEKTINPVSISFSRMIKEAISSPWIEKPSE
jgi:hypothetical protein